MRQSLNAIMVFNIPELVYRLYIVEVTVSLYLLAAFVRKLRPSHLDELGARC